MQERTSPARIGVLAGLLFVWAAAHPWAAMTTIPKGKPRGSQEVRKALEASTQQGKVEALIRVLTGDELPSAMEALDALAAMGPSVVPRLVSEMRRSRNNWLIGGALAKMGAEAVGPLIELLEQADEATAVNCIYLLGEIQDRRAVPTLARYVEDPREKVRMYAVTSLIAIGGDKAIEAVISRLTREGKGLSGFIVESVLRYGRRSSDTLLRNLTSADPKVRREVAYLLGRLEDPRAADALLSLLNDPDPPVRRNAVFALGALSRTLHEPDHVVLGLAGMLDDPDPDTAGAAGQAIARFGEGVVPVLIEKCRTAKGDELIAAVNALREIGSPAAEETMIGLLEHPERSVRMAAAAALMVVGTGKAVEPLLNALRDENLRWFASLALERLGPEKPDLFLVTQPSDPTLALKTQILVRLGPPVVPAMAAHLRGDSLGKRVIALWVLGEIGDERVTRDVADLLVDPNVGWLAGRTLHKLGDAGLEELLRRAANPAKESEALQALDALAFFEEPRAIAALENAVKKNPFRSARIRAAVRLSTAGEPAAIDRLRTYLDGDGKDLWPDVRMALRSEGQIR